MNKTDIEIRKVLTEDDKFIFIKLPWCIYRNDDNWVPPFIFDLRRRLSPSRNPFFTHAETAFFVAYKNKRPCGRIAAIVNHNHNKIHNDKVGFFGFFESVDDYNVSDALFNAAVDFLKSKGMDTVRGPVNLSTNDEVGLLIDGFNSPPVFLMTYNPQYYAELIHNFGFTKIKDLYAYHVSENIVSDEKVMGKLRRLSEVIKTREKIDFRKLKIKELDRELMLVMEVYNKAWQYNWGFVPMNKDEFKNLVAVLRPVVDPDLVYIAEFKGKPVGFSIALPDYNQVFIKMNGKLFPFGLFKFICNRKKINGIRLITMGIIQEFQKKGIEAVFIKDTIEISYSKGYRKAEISWVLEDNIPMVQTAVNLGAKLYKTYRIYDKKI